MISVGRAYKIRNEIKYSKEVFATPKKDEQGAWIIKSASKSYNLLNENNVLVTVLMQLENDSRNFERFLCLVHEVQLYNIILFDYELEEVQEQYEQ